MKITSISCQHAQLPFGMIVGGPAQYQHRVAINESMSLRRFTPASITAPRMEHVVLHLAPVKAIPASGTFYVLKGRFESDFVALQSGRYPIYSTDMRIDHTELVRVGAPNTSYMILGNPYFSGEVEVHNLYGEDAIPFSIDVAMDDGVEPQQASVVLTPTIVLVDDSRFGTEPTLLEPELSQQGLPELIATAALLRTQYPTTAIRGNIRAAISEHSYHLTLNALGYHVNVIPSETDSRVGLFSSVPPFVLSERPAGPAPTIYVPFGEKGCLKYYYGISLEDIEDGVFTPPVQLPQIELPEDFPADGHVAYYITTGSEQTTGFQFEVTRWGREKGHLLQPLMVLFNHVSSIPIKVANIGQTVEVVEL